MTADGSDPTRRSGADGAHDAERAALSRREQSLLVCIERALYRDDPSFVRRFEGRTARGSGRLRWFRRGAGGSSTA